MRDDPDAARALGSARTGQLELHVSPDSSYISEDRKLTRLCVYCVPLCAQLPPQPQWTVPCSVVSAYCVHCSVGRGRPAARMSTTIRSIRGAWRRARRASQIFDGPRPSIRSAASRITSRTARSLAQSRHRSPDTGCPCRAACREQTAADALEARKALLLFLSVRRVVYEKDSVPRGDSYFVCARAGSCAAARAGARRGPPAGPAEKCLCMYRYRWYPSFRRPAHTEHTLKHARHRLYWTMRSVLYPSL